MLQSRIRELSAAFMPEAIRIRRHLHMNPELSYQEDQTSEFIHQLLKQWGIAHTRNHARTGIVAILRGKDPDRHTLLLRADMDALPIHEKNEVPYKSLREGVMHACGHDVHMTCLLGAVHVLHQLRDQWTGTIKAIFQPGEEVLPGGASIMISEGVLENPKVDAAIALHVFPSMEAGQVGFRKGMYMASTDELYLTVNGKGGHAAMVAETNTPVLPLSAILLEIERTFMAPGAADRAGANGVPTVIAFGKVEAMGATNVIPPVAKAAGTFRTMNEAWRAQVHQKMKEIVQRIANEYGVTADLRIEHGYPFLVNDEKITGRCSSAAADYLGSKNVHELPIRMTAEDFAYITQKVPSCFFRLGTGNSARGITAGVHSDKFDVDESAIETGIGLMSWLGVSAL